MNVETLETLASNTASVFLERDETRLEIRLGDQPVGYRMWFDRDGEWMCFGETFSQVVYGDFFALRAASISQTKERVVLRGTTPYQSLNGALLTYDWRLELSLNEHGWLEVDLELDLPEAGRFNQTVGYEPALLFDLGPRPPYDRGHNFWARTELLGYSRFDHTPNNDLPGLYYRDPFRRARLLMFFDTAAMNWMSADTMARFRDYRLGSQEYGGLVRGQRIGLYGVSHSGTGWRAGKSRIVYSLHLRDEPRQTNDRQALEDLISSLGVRVKATPDLEYPLTWAQLATGTAHDLEQDACWSLTPQGNWLRPYVDDHSPAWAAVSAWEGRGNENLGGTPYMLWFQETVLAALEFGVRFTALGGAMQPARDRVRSSSLAHYASLESVFDGYLSSNMTDDAVSGTWQYVHSITTYWQIGRTLGLKEVMRCAEAEIHARLLPLLERHAFIPPTTHSRSSLEKVGPSVSFSVLGLCADLFSRLAEAAVVKDRPFWIELSLRSILTLARAPEYAVHQESNHLGQALLAVSRLLGLQVNDSELEAHAALLTNQALRQFYWCEETSTPSNHPRQRVRGLSSCCTPMGYSAFWENISQALAFASAYAKLEPNLTMLRFLNVLREHAKGSIPAALEDTNFARAFIPLEDIKLLEVAHDPVAGQEVYGAGHVIWAYGLFEAFCRLEVKNPEILVLCTNLLDPPDRLESRRTFLVFNAGARAQQVRGDFTIPGFMNSRWRVYAASDKTRNLEHGYGHFEFALQTLAWVKLEVNGGNT